jgi:hypothetical protein
LVAHPGADPHPCKILPLPCRRQGKPGRVAPGIAPWRSHRSVRAQLRHTVRPVMDSPSRFAIRGRYVDPRTRYGALDGLPNHESMTNISLPSTGSPRYRFPSFDSTMKMCDSLPPSRRASLPSLGDTLCGACRSLPAIQNAKSRARGSHAGPPTGLVHRETIRVSQVPGESWYAYALLFDPGRTDVTGHTSPSARPPLCPQRRLPRKSSFRGSITRLWHSLSTLRQVPHDTRRKTRFPLSATLRDGIGYPQDSYERFQTVVILPSQASWRKDILDSF